MIERLSIKSILNGAVVERINEAIKAAVANVTDFEYPEAGKRTVTCKLVFEPMGNRERPICQPSVSVKLAEKALPATFVNINVFKKEGWVTNEEQAEMFTETPSYSFSPEFVPELSNVNHGDLIKEINLAIQDVVDNISDPDTPIKGRREVAISLHFAVAEKAIRRNQITCQPVVSTKPQSRAITSQVFDLLPTETAAAGLLLYSDQLPKHTKEVNTNA